MKAKVKSTGAIIDIDDIYGVLYETSTHDIYDKSELDFPQTALTRQDIAKIDDMPREVENCVATSDLPTTGREEYYTEKEMKAKIKETGKWVTVNPCNEGFYDVNTHDIYDPDELDFAAELDWQAFRREAAKDILAGMLSNPESIHISNKRLRTIEDFVDSAVMIADVLIRQLQ